MQLETKVAPDTLWGLVAAVGTAAAGALASAASYAVWFARKRTIGIRVSEEEVQGLDAGEHGMEAYPGLVPGAREPIAASIEAGTELVTAATEA